MSDSQGDPNPHRFQDARLTIEGAVAVFTHDRPDQRNALSEGLQASYSRMLDVVQADRRIRALVITGSGGSFCAGGDLNLLAARQADPDPDVRSADAVRARVAAAHRWVNRLRSLQIPVVAAVDGPAMGAGFSLALAADFIFASTRGVFCMSFSKVGLIPDLGAFYLLPRIVGLQMAKELAMTARRVDAEEGRRLGFVHSIYEKDRVLPEAVNFAQRFSDGPREAIGLSKTLMNASFETDYATLAELEGQGQAIASTASYHASAVASFLSRKPLTYDWDRRGT